MMMQLSDWMTIKDASQYLKMSVGFLRKAVREQRIPFARVGSKVLRFRREELDRWLEANSCGGEITYHKHEGR
jgi:excisionase family DNA binding protein